MRVLPSHTKLSSSWLRAHYAGGKRPRQRAQTRSPRNGFICHWATDKDDETTTSDHRNENDSNKDPMNTRRLINSLLQIQSLQSVEDLHIADESAEDLHTANHVDAKRQQQEHSALVAVERQESNISAAKGASEGLNSSPGPYTLFDDPAAEDYDPLVLYML